VIGKSLAESKLQALNNDARRGIIPYEEAISQMDLVLADCDGEVVHRLSSQFKDPLEEKAKNGYLLERRYMNLEGFKAHYEKKIKRKPGGALRSLREAYTELTKFLGDERYHLTDEAEAFAETELERLEVKLEQQASA